MKNYFLMTRYNLGVIETLRKHGKDADEWMNDRLRLFKTYCEPSVYAQTYQPFKWIILLDSRTTNEQRYDISNSIRYKNTEFITVDWPERKFKESASQLSGWVKDFARIAGGGEAVMTRLDNDDAISKIYYERLAVYAEKLQGRWVVDSPSGICYDEKSKLAYYYVRPYGSPFITIQETVSTKMKTPYFTCHRNVALSNRIRIEMSLSPAWLMVLHKNNHTNREYSDWNIGEGNWCDIKGDFGL